jgi:hypothetical protein
MKWYNASHKESTQGLIIEEETGRNVAVSYDVKDTELIAAAPELLDVVIKFMELTDVDDIRNIDGEVLYNVRNLALSVMDKACPNGTI